MCEVEYMRCDRWEIKVFVFVEEKNSRYVDAWWRRHGHFESIN
jgi:hypothetical protein